jgi:hypothetical protein
MFPLLTLVRPQYAVFFFVAAGLALMVQAKRLGVVLMIAGVAVIVLPPMLSPLRALLPAWLLLALGVGSALTIGRAVLTIGIGRSAANHAVGVLAADVIRFVVLLPFRLVGGLGSRLLQIQNARSAARATADRKLAASLS